MQYPARGFENVLRKAHPRNMTANPKNRQCSYSILFSLEVSIYTLKKASKTCDVTLGNKFNSPGIFHNLYFFVPDEVAIILAYREE